MRIGIIGAAGITGRALIEPAREVEGVEVCAIAARDPGRAAAQAAEHGIPEVLPTYEALLADDSIDAIYVPLANSLHAQWSIAALEAGKHVLCEKPSTSNADQAAEVVAVAEANDRLFVEAMHWRYHPVADRMIELAQQIGPLSEISAYFSILIPSDNVRYDLSLAGGAMMDLGCYCIHMLRSVVGTEPAVESASAVEGPKGIDVTMDASMRFPGEVAGALHCSMVGVTTWPDSMYISARGAKGSMKVWNPMAPQWGHRLTAELDDGETVDEVIDGAPSYVHQLRAFAENVSGTSRVLTGGTDTVNNMRAIDAIYVASGLGRRA